jgi:hypothetical protein
VLTAEVRNGLLEALGGGIDAGTARQWLRWWWAGQLGLLLVPALFSDHLPSPLLGQDFSGQAISVGLWRRWVWRLHEVEAKAWMTTSADTVPSLEASFFYLSSYRARFRRWKPSFNGLACRRSWHRFLLEGFARQSSFCCGPLAVCHGASLRVMVLCASKDDGARSSNLSFLIVVS